MPNRLARETSPYLLQHADNPVDWYPWGDEAFERARADDKPIFLSVGCSTCHWCHVMEHESFENAEVAAVLNAYFVPVKVDREERPDVDRVYMTFVQATTGAGGWPMSVWLTPDLRPFYGGTYFPPTSRWGRPGFVELLRELGRLWREERSRVLEAAAGLTEQLAAVVGRSYGASGPVSGQAVPAAAELRAAAADFTRAFDRRHAGFGQAPKFPRPSELLLLLREYAHTGNRELVEMAGATLRAMALGGMRDHVGGGFHRYSVDAEWRVPHFEKMLYDQAQIVLALLELRQITGDGFWAAVADDTLTYVLRDLTHPDGGFYSAEDADSVPPDAAGPAAATKVEGAFYLWGADEIDALLGESADAVKARFGILPGGNAPHDPQGEFGSGNLLYTALSIEDVATQTGRTVDAVMDILTDARRRLFDARATRPRPHLDDKVLTAWNGLMIAAFARAARTLDGDTAVHPQAGQRSLEAATRAAAFIEGRLWDRASGVLFRRFRDGRAGIPGYAEDYACLVWGLIELFQSCGDAQWLDWAIELQHHQDRLFWDAGDGGWFGTTGHDPSVLWRMKDDHDGAEPSASSVSALNLLALVHLVGDRDDWSAHADRALARFGPALGQHARILPMLLAALAVRHAVVHQVVVVGPRDRADTVALRRVLADRYLPFAVTVPVEPGPAQDRLARTLPFVGAMQMVGGRATAFVCRGFACDRPVTDADALDAALGPRGI
jgi:hypothetical protein